jgi:hypothetical protein
MAKDKRKRTPKTVLKLPDLEQFKSSYQECACGELNHRIQLHGAGSLPIQPKKLLGCDPMSVSE